jgi:hypothetical protein
LTTTTNHRASGSRVYGLPDNYEYNMKILEKILGLELKQETGMFSEGWWLWPVGRYVESSSEGKAL